MIYQTFPLMISGKVFILLTLGGSLWTETDRENGFLHPNP